MSDSPLASFYTLFQLPAETEVTLQRLDVLAWGQTLVFAGVAGDQPFTLRYTDCREIRWRIYVSNPSESTPLVSFVPGRDQQRSPAQFLTAHFGLSLYYGSVEVTVG
jgi:hypothetical protein